MRVKLTHYMLGELISTLRGHQKGVLAAAFYPVGHTSALLATGGEDCTARLWDTRSRKEALTMSGGHADAVYVCALLFLYLSSVFSVLSIFAGMMLRGREMDR